MSNCYLEHIEKSITLAHKFAFRFCLQLGNHDNSRVASRYGPERVDALNAMLLTLPGAGVTYNVIFFSDWQWDHSNELDLLGFIRS